MTRLLPKSGNLTAEPVGWYEIAFRARISASGAASAYFADGTMGVNVNPDGPVFSMLLEPRASIAIDAVGDDNLYEFGVGALVPLSTYLTIAAELGASKNLTGINGSQTQFISYWDMVYSWSSTASLSLKMYIPWSDARAKLKDWPHRIRAGNE